MNNYIKKLLLPTLAIALTGLTACDKANSATDQKAKTAIKTKVNSENIVPASRETIYVASNKTSGNSIVAFAQKNDGTLTSIGEYPTGGKGTGNIEIFDGGYDYTEPLADGVDPLISAYGVFKTPDNKNLLVVNSGDGTVSSLKINRDKSLTINNVVKAGDIHPVSIASHGSFVYVASSGSVSTPPFSGNILGYKVDSNGKLTSISNSLRDLRARPTCIAFTEDGKFLVVAELVSGLVKVYGVQNNGSLTDKPISMVSSPHDASNDRWLPIPVGFDLVKKGTNTTVLVSEARFLNNKGMLRPDPNKVPQSPKYSWQTGSTSSYVIDKSGQIKMISGDVMTGTSKEGGQIANCWVEISPDGNTLWASNALSSSITSYTIGGNGSLTLRNEKAFKKKSEDLFFSDTYISADGKYLNQLIGNRGAVMVFKVKSNGDLEEVGMFTSSDLPMVGAYGLIVI
ncbi:beta-propeller fold lactonase family protein [Aquimarina sp. 2201CG5-10]|uniref:beta-propeller fold lactonase family protein n=1 Tax=Aquimarina callyspongiae TaxID=3098150 RepID=UPI002AB4D98A|nr:beta-propeller fold lactonase family protein [Aquimarina sp. 2201CG5-10]MDY8138419.1 beta-propeller fold lactonase family protein [Aquimarina sp. 2201CG5-10]